MQGKTIKLWKIENDRENHIGDMNALILEAKEYAERDS